LIKFNCIFNFEKFKGIFEEKSQEIESEEYAMAFILLEKENEELLNALEVKTSIEVKFFCCC